MIFEAVVEQTLIVGMARDASQLSVRSCDSVQCFVLDSYFDEPLFFAAEIEFHGKSLCLD